MLKSQSFKTSYLLCLLLGSVFLFDSGSPASAQDIYLVKDINPTGDAFNPIATPTEIIYEIVDIDGTVFFTANDGVHGHELWKSDGTAEGTAMVRDIFPGQNSSSPQQLRRIGDILYFVAEYPIERVLYRSDGTADGTHPVSEGVQVAAELVVFKNRLWFAGNTPQPAIDPYGVELWTSDGSAAGTIRFKDIDPQGNSFPHHFAVADDYLFFSASTWTSGEELYRTDGTPNGTILLRDIRPGPEDSAITWEVRSANGLLYFNANDGIAGEEPWVSDGTLQGTRLLKDLQPDPDFVEGASYPKGFRGIENGVVFEAWLDPRRHNNLWITDGTAAGTRQVYDPDAAFFVKPYHEFVTFKGEAYFRGKWWSRDENVGLESTATWKTDGTPEGTVRMTTARINFGRDYVVYPWDLPTTSIYRPTIVGDYLFFHGIDSEHGRELWKTDGTVEGTVLVEDLNPGPYPADTTPRALCASHGRLFFIGDAGGPEGIELYAIKVFDPPVPPVPPPGRLVNLSTRAWVGTGNDVMIAGFIIEGGPLNVLLRARGPSLAPAGIPNPLSDPQIELFSGQTSLLANDDWRDSQESEIEATGLAPTSNAESAIVAELQPGPYTAIVSGVGNTTGIGIVEVFELD